MQMTLKHFQNILATVYFIFAPHVRTALIQKLSLFDADSIVQKVLRDEIN